MKAPLFLLFMMLGLANIFATGTPAPQSKTLKKNVPTISGTLKEVTPAQAVALPAKNLSKAFEQPSVVNSATAAGTQTSVRNMAPVPVAYQHRNFFQRIGDRFRAVKQLRRTLVSLNHTNYGTSNRTLLIVIVFSLLVILAFVINPILGLTVLIVALLVALLLLL